MNQRQAVLTVIGGWYIIQARLRNIIDPLCWP